MLGKTEPILKKWFGQKKKKTLLMFYIPQLSIFSHTAETNMLEKWDSSPQRTVLLARANDNIVDVENLEDVLYQKHNCKILERWKIHTRHTEHWHEPQNANKHLKKFKFSSKQNLSGLIWTLDLILAAILLVYGGEGITLGPL